MVPAVVAMMASWKFRWQRFVYFCLLPMVLLATFYVGPHWAYTAGYRLNFSRSMALGFYRIQLPIGQIERGDAVVFCLPKNRVPADFDLYKNGACPLRNMPLLKSIIGVPGDHVQMTSRGVLINGHLIAGSACHLGSQLNTRLVCMQYQQTLPEDVYWVMGTGSSAADALRSFDSRYFGPISVRFILGLAKPIKE